MTVSRSGRGSAAALFAVLAALFALAGPARAQSTPDGGSLNGCSSSGYDGYDFGSCDVSVPSVRLSQYPDTARVGGSTQLSAYSAGQGLRFEWDLDDDGVYDDGTAGDASTTFAVAGQHVVRVRVTDRDGRQGLAETQVDVHATNRVPGGELAVRPTRPHPGQAVQVTPYGYDIDGEVARIDLDLDGDGTFETRSDYGEA